MDRRRRRRPDCVRMRRTYRPAARRGICSFDLFENKLLEAWVAITAPLILFSGRTHASAYFRRSRNAVRRSLITDH
jgi:hypothetical protein